ncbi:hypothetical protein RclHR1_16740005 [Rhizophagus clarus]|uniref:Uncharacterized protein n=1 Tax=Rhizophagus clarus TaxID=94130 RepID=A0A2Z6QYW4_9GLOM|nr:hypothetical protein RclHR1_16740005 [Rhizophagus clarus]GES95276.1 hypothetical protein GLOIN_2v1475818 [Rhizophagus clarus]
MKAKFVCYHLKNTSEICDNSSDKPKGYYLHCKAKICLPCRVCDRPIEIDKPSRIDNELCSYCNKSNYQIHHMNILQDKTQIYDQYNEKVIL